MLQFCDEPQQRRGSSWRITVLCHWSQQGHGQGQYLCHTQGHTGTVHTLTQPSHTAEPRACGLCLLPWARDTNHQTQQCPPPAPTRPEPTDEHSTEPDAVKRPQAQKSTRRIFSTDNTIFVSPQLNGRVRFWKLRKKTGSLSRLHCLGTESA